MICFIITIFFCTVNAQWLLLEEDSPEVLTTEANAKLSGRRNAATWCFKDDIFILGGNDGTSNRNDVWKYETENRRWVWQPDVPLKITPNSLSHAAYWEIMGEFFVYTTLGKLWMYKPEQRRWSEIIPTNIGIDPGPRLASAFWVHKPSNELYLYGGSNQSSNSDMWAYNTISNSWRQVQHVGDSPSTSTNIAHTTAVLGNSEDTVYIFVGGRLYQLDLTTYTWSISPTSGTQSPPDRLDYSLWMSPTQEKVHLFGGHKGSEVLNDWWTYNQIQQQWHVNDEGSGPNGRWGQTGCRDSKGNFYMFGGTFEDPTNTYNDLWKNGPLTASNILTLLEFKLDAVTIGSTVAATMSTMLVVGCFFACLCLACKKCRRYRKYKDSVKLYPSNSGNDEPFMSPRRKESTEL